MSRTFIRLAVLVTLTALLLSPLAGCSRFKTKKRINLAPFAEDMIALAGDLQYGLGRLQPVYLQGYIDVSELKNYDRLGAALRQTLRCIIGYSIQVVTLGESELDGPARTAALADYLDGLVRPVLQIKPLPPLQITIAEFDTMQADIRSRTDLLGGLRASQPMVDEIARLSGELFDQAGGALETVRAAIEREIDADFEEVVVADRQLRSMQIRTVRDITLLPRIRGGDVTASDSLRTDQPSLRGILEPGTLPGEADLIEIERRLLFILNSLGDLRTQLEPDLVHYREAKRELGLLVNEYRAALRKGRVAIIAWARAHDLLAAGVTDPAEINVMGIAHKAAGGFVPF